MRLPKTIKKTQEGLIKGEFSAVDLVDKYLARIKKYDGQLNAFITVTDDYAYQKAKEIDILVKDLGMEAGRVKPLLGCIFSAKDIYLTEGLRTTAGSKVLDNYIAHYSASVIKKLEGAGAILIGKTNCDAWAHGSSGENSDYGPTKNPWNTEFVPGGSSSGAGASVAAGLSLIATATDTCGSTRLPANYCGLVGLKPTYGAVSRYGVIAMASSLDSMGHITKTVEDSRKVFEVVRGEDGFDSSVLGFRENPLAHNKKFKIGIPKEFFAYGLDKEVEKAILEAKDTLGREGVEFKEVSLPHTKYGISVYYIIQPAEVSSNLGRYDGIRYGTDRSVFADEAKRRIMLGTYVLSAGYYDAYYLKAMKVRTIIKNEINRVFEEVDAIIAPVVPTPPFKIGEKASDPIEMYLTDILAATANLSGIPALAVPCGFTQKGMPLGFQLMGPRFSENVLFKLGEIYQDVTNWHTKEPIL